MRSRTVLAVDRRTGVGVIGEVAWGAVAAVLCLGVGLVCLVLAVARVGDRPTQLTHAAMGVAMAGMFAPWGDPVPMWVGVGAFTLLGTWFTALGLRRDRAARTTRHLTISSAAMVLMYVMPDGRRRHHAARAPEGTLHTPRRTAVPPAWSPCSSPWCWRLLRVAHLDLRGTLPVGEGRRRAGRRSPERGPDAGQGRACRTRHDERPHGGDVPGRDLTGRTHNRGDTAFCRETAERNC